MKVASGIALLASAGFASAATMGSRADVSRRAVQTSQQLCAAVGPIEENGNYFCGAVSQIKYTGVGGPAGSYQKVVAMDPNTGKCEKEDHPYSGPLGPYKEGQALFVRGPIQMAQLAFYTPGSNEKRDLVAPVKAKRHGHKHARFQHKHSHLHSEREAPKEAEKRADWVVATINGQVVSWENNWFGPETPAPAAPAVATAPAAAAAPAPEVSTPAAPVANPSPDPVAGVQAGAYVKPTSAAAPAVAKPTPAPVTGDYIRKAYYNAKAGTSEGMTFVANYGGQGSGKWTPTFGNTLSYVDSTGQHGASSPQVLGEVVIPSNKEVGIYSDEECNGDCGFVQDGTVAYKGFRGDDKVFLIEFSMPNESDDGYQGNMPAVWFLHENIAQTQQYGDCSCWGSGCGEADIFETLAKGDFKCKSTLHSNVPGGDSNYFVRPVDRNMKAAIVFDSVSGEISIKVLPSSYEFPASLSPADVQALLAADGGAMDGKSLGASLFAVTS